MHVVIEAMPEILCRYADSHCVIVGGDHEFEPDYPEVLRDRICALHLQDRVTLVGLQRNIPEWMQASDVVVHASDNEPFGIVIIEAMALGKPVVATDSAGPTEIISHGVDGLLTPFGDSKRLAKAILQYLDQPDFGAAVAGRARKRALTFSTRLFAQRITSEVGRVVQRNWMVDDARRSVGRVDPAAFSWAPIDEPLDECSSKSVDGDDSPIEPVPRASKQPFRKAELSA